MIVLVTGGTGFVGREVVRQLHGAGHAIRLLVRDTQSVAVHRAVEQFGVQPCPGNVLQSDAVESAMRGADAVIHLVGIISEYGNQTFENVHTRATQNVVAAARAAGVRRFVHMSALGTRPNARARYHQTKWAAEVAVRASGLAWTIFRPSIIYGPGDGFVNLFVQMSRFSPAIPLIGGGHTRLHPIPVADVARAFVGALNHSKSYGQTLDLCGAEILTLREIVQAVLAVTNRRRLLVSLPFWAARLQAFLLELVLRHGLGRPSPLTRDQVLMVQEDNVGDGSRAAQWFRLKPVAFRDGIAAYLASAAH